MRTVTYNCDWCKFEVEFERLWELSLDQPCEIGVPHNKPDQLCPNCRTAVYMAVVPVERKIKGLDT